MLCRWGKNVTKGRTDKEGDSRSRMHCKCSRSLSSAVSGVWIQYHNTLELSTLNSTGSPSMAFSRFWSISQNTQTFVHYIAEEVMAVQFQWLSLILGKKTICSVSIQNLLLHNSEIVEPCELLLSGFSLPHFLHTHYVYSLSF